MLLQGSNGAVLYDYEYELDSTRGKKRIFNTVTITGTQRGGVLPISNWVPKVDCVLAQCAAFEVGGCILQAGVHAERSHYHSYSAGWLRGRGAGGVHDCVVILLAGRCTCQSGVASIVNSWSQTKASCRREFNASFPVIIKAGDAVSRARYSTVQ